MFSLDEYKYMREVSCAAKAPAESLKMLNAILGIDANCPLASAQKPKVMQEMKELFCSNPPAFCKRFRNMPAAERTGAFTNSKCQPGTAFNPSLASAAAKTSIDYGGRAFNAWGCSYPNNEPPKQVGSGADAPFEVTMSCDSSKMPVPCDSAITKKKGGSDTQQSQKSFMLSALQLGAKFEAKGDKCQIRLAAQPKELQMKIVKLFDLANILSMPDNPQGLAFTARTVFTPQVRADLDRKFAAAKTGVLAYLKKIGAPEGVVNRVKNTNPMDFSLFDRLPLQVKTKGQPGYEQYLKDKLLLAEYNTHCGGKFGGMFGKAQAANCPAGPNHQVVVCPQTVLNAEVGNPSSLLSTMTHELAHSFDPCSLGKAQMGTFSGMGDDDEKTCKQPPESPLDPKTGAEDAFITKATQMAECLHCHSNVDGKNGDQVRAGKQIDAFAKLYADYNDQSLSDYKAKHSCIYNALTNSPAKYCPFFQVDCDMSKPSCKPAKYAQAEQVNETFADTVSANSLVDAMKAYDPAPTTANMEDMLTTVSVHCGEMDEQAALDSDPADQHPPDDFRIITYAQTPSVRSAVGCDALPTPADKTMFASAQCGLDKAPVACGQ